MRICGYFFVLFGITHRAFADNPGNCNISMVTWGAANEYVHPTINDSDEINLKIPFFGKLEIKSTTATPAGSDKYFNVKVTGHDIVFTSTPQFKDFEKEYGCYTVTKPSEPKFILTTTLFCETARSSSVDFIFTVRDTNNHAPVFTKSTYEYKVAMPLVPGIDYTLQGDLIIAEDVDFSNKNITFSINANDDFILASKPTVPNCLTKRQAVIQAKTFTWLKSELTELVLTATDAGNIPRKSTTKLNFRRNPDAVLPEVPRFSKPSYNFDYLLDGNVKGESVKLLNSDVDNFAVAIDKGDDYSPKFTLIRKTGTTEYDLSFTGPPLESVPVPIIFLTVTATPGSSGASESVKSSAVLSIKLPDKIVGKAAKFSKPHYTASYKITGDNHSVNLDEEITTIPSDADVSVSKDQNGVFGVSFEALKEAASWKIKVSKPLDDAILKKGESVSLVLETNLKTDKNKTVFATVVIKLPGNPNKPTFKRSFYLFKYTLGNKISGNRKDSLESADDDIRLNGTIGSDASVDFFNSADKLRFNLSKTGEIYKISLISNLPNDVLKKGDDLKVVLKVTDTNGEGTTTVIIKLSKYTPPKFTKSLYFGRYEVIEGKTDYVEMNGEISLLGPIDQCSFKPEKYNSNFNFQCSDNNKCSFDVTHDLDLDNETASKLSEIIFDLTASTDIAEDFSTASLKLTLPPKVSDVVPTFSQTHYVARYVKNDNDSGFNLRGDIIKIVSPRADQTIVKPTTYSDNFKVDSQGTGMFTLNIKSELDDKILGSKAQLFVDLEATILGNKNIAKAVVVVDLIKNATDLKKPPTFMKSYFIGEYVIESSSPSVRILDTPIQIKGSDHGIADVTVIGNFSKNFRTVLKTDKWDVEVIQKLDDSILLKQTQIVVDLNAYAPGSSGNGQAALLVNLPQVPKIKFDRPIYQAKYIKNQNGLDNVELVDDIQINEVGASLSVVKDYQANFKIECGTDKKCKVNVQKNLKDDLLNKQANIIFDIEATKSGFDKGISTIVISLPKKDTAAVALFTKNVYTAQYVIGKDGDSVKVDEKIELKDAEAEVKISGAYSKNFSTVKTGAEITVNVNKKLQSDVLTQNTRITIELTATKDKSEATSIIILYLPTKYNPGLALEFTAPVYTFIYSNPGLIQLENGPIKIKDIVDTAQVKVKLEGENEKYFSLMSEKDSWNLQLKDEKDLPDNLRKEISIALGVTGESIDNTKRGDAVLVIKLPKQIVNNKIRFSKYFYTATYSKTSNQLEVIGNIELEGDMNGVIIASVNIGEDYRQYFTATHDGFKLSVFLNENHKIPDQIVKDHPSIIVTLAVTFTDKAVITAPLIVELKDPSNEGNNSDQNSKTGGLVAAVSVLAVLLVIVLVGSALFYYLKFRRHLGAKALLEDEVADYPRFTKKSNGENKNKYVNPAERRPTGLLMSFSIPDNNHTESNTDYEEPVERRKSVQFDTNVQELVVEPTEVAEESEYVEVVDGDVQRANGDVDKK